MNIWEEPDDVRIAAAKMRVLELLALCPPGGDRQYQSDHRLLDEIVASVVAMGSQRARVAVAGGDLDPVARPLSERGTQP